MQWSGAEASCVSMNSNLVSVANSIDQDFIWQTLYINGKQEMWIGLNDLQTVNEYHWTDGKFVSQLSILEILHILLLL